MRPGFVSTIVRHLLSSSIVALLVLFSSRAVLAQDPVTVRGVVSAAGQPVDGASVRIPELDIGAYTDGFGAYHFIVPSSRVVGQSVHLVARRRGFADQSVVIALVGGSLVRNFELAAPRVGTTPVIAAGAAQGAGRPPVVAVRVPMVVRPAVLDSSVFAELPGPTSWLSALAGRVPGLDVATASAEGGTTRLVVRGPESISGSSQPLVVVDGVPLSSGELPRTSTALGLGGFDFGSYLSTLPAADIASVEVIQGARAVALYGGRAAAGVISVVTKKGGGGPLEISAHQLLSFESPLRLPSYQNSYGQGLGGQFMFVDGTNGINDAVDQSWGPALDGRPVTQFSYYLARHADVRYWDPQPDNVRDFFALGRTLRTDVTAVGGSDLGTLRFSADRQSTAGVLPENSLSRLTMALGGTAAPSPRFALDASIRYAGDDGTDRPAVGATDANPMVGFARMGRQVDLATLRHRLRDTTGAQINWNYVDHNDPWFQALENHNADHATHVLGNVGARVKLADWLDGEARIGAEDHSASRALDLASGWLGAYPYLGVASGAVVQGSQRESISDRTIDVDARLTATRRWSGGSAAITAGAADRNRSTHYTVDATGPVDTTAAGANAVRSFALDAPDELRSALASFALTKDGVGEIDAAVHRDWYSTLSSSGHAEWSPALAGRLSITNLWRSAGVDVDDASLHGGWSRAADDRAMLPLRLDAAWQARAAAAAGDTTPRAPLRTVAVAEVTSGWELGTGLSALRQRLGLDLSYYHQQTDGQLLPAFIGATTTPTILNAGTVTNQGVEAQLHLGLLGAPGESGWDVSFVAAHNTSRVESLPNGMTSVALGPSVAGLSVQARNGEPLGVLVGRRFLRDPSTHELLLRDGLPLPDTTGAPVVLGHTSPDWTGGVATSARLGRLELAITVDGRWGGSIFSASNLYGAYAGTLQETAFRPDSGLLIRGIDVATGAADTTHVTTEAYYHSLLPIQERWVYDASFVKLREARLSFQITPSFTGSGRVSTVRVSLVGRNLALWTRVPNIDPEDVLGVGSYQGIELGQLPSTRSMGVQVTVTP